MTQASSVTPAALVLALGRCSRTAEQIPEDTSTHEVTTSDPQVHATTAFTADDQAKPAEPVSVSKGRYDILSSRDYSGLSLHELISQPVPVLSGVFTPPDAGVLSFNSHDRILVESPFHLEKLRGYHGLRASVTLRLVVNADKYTQGTVCVSFLPATIETVEKRSDHRHVTQLSHVELDFNTDTEVSLTIPHRGPYTHFDLIERRYNTGVFLVTTTLEHRGNPVPYTVYMSYSDVDLQAPTSTFQVAYEAGDLVKKSKQSKRVAFREEEKTSAGGSWSSALASVSSVATIASAVPILTPMTEPLAWASGVASKVCAAFGWSRPIRDTTPMVYLQRDLAKLTHVDGEEYAEPLAQTTLAQVRATDQIGLTTQDEMSFAYLCGIKSQIFRFNYGVSTPTGTKLFTLPLDPGHMAADSGFPLSISGNPRSALIAHPMFYIANLHGMYRGSLGVGIKLSKTIFHSGRLMVVFEPFYTDTNATSALPAPRVNTIADAINCHKDIVDIRAGDEFSFTFPFTSPTPYKPIGFPYGYMHIFVLNQLVRNDTAVSEFIDVGIRVHGCEDLEFTVPTDPVYWPLRLGPTEESEPFGGDARTLDNVLYESGLEVRDTILVEKPIGSSIKPEDTSAMAELAIGEKLLSMKQIAMKSKVVQIFGGTKLPQIDPFIVDQFYGASVGEAGMKQWFDFYSYVGSLYTYARGGVILTIHKNGGGPMCISYTHFPDPSSAVPRAPYAEFRNLLTLKAGAGADRVYVPPYNASFVRYNHSTPGGFAPGIIPLVFQQAGFSQTKIRLHSMSGDGVIVDGQVYQIYRSASEDAQFGAFMGVPYLIMREPFFSAVPQHYRAQLTLLANS